MPNEQKKTQLQVKNPVESPKLNKIETALRESDSMEFVSAKEKSTDIVQTEVAENPKIKRKQQIIVSSIVAAFVVLLGGGWLAYALYQDPNNAVTSAIAQTFSSKSFSTTGTMSYGSQVRAKFDTQFSRTDGYSGFAEFSAGNTGSKESTKVVAEVVGEPNEDTYFRIKNLGTMLDVLLEPYAAIGKSNQIIGVLLDTYRVQFQPIINGIDNKWIKYGVSEIRKINEARAIAFECMQDVVWGVGDDTGQLIELGLLYQNNRFVVVKESLGIIDGNLGYLVGVNKKDLNRFSEAFKTSKLYKDIRACSKDVDELFGAFEDDIAVSKMSVQVWVDQWSHQLEKIHIEDEENEFSIDIKFSFDKSVKIDLPKESTSYSKVAPEIDSLMGILGLGALVGK